MSQLDHIANRIGWRARKNAVWTKNTRMWKDASSELKERVAEELRRPVFFSVADESEGIVFGADGALVVSGDRTQVVPYKDLVGVKCSEVGIETPQAKEFVLNLNVKSKGTIRAKVEGGAAGYGVWRVLKMVMTMDDAWFAPEPEPEPESDVNETETASADEAEKEAEPGSDQEPAEAAPPASNDAAQDGGSVDAEAPENAPEGAGDSGDDASAEVDADSLPAAEDQPAEEAAPNEATDSQAGN